MMANQDYLQNKYRKPISESNSTENVNYIFHLQYDPLTLLSCSQTAVLAKV